MHQGSRLTAADRRHIRRIVDKYARTYGDARYVVHALRDIFAGDRPGKAYAYAYLGALMSAEPLQLDSV